MANPITCGTCRHSIPAKMADGKIDFTRRFCRRYPPHPLMMPKNGGISMEFVWPVLDTAQVCGEWQNSDATDVALPGQAPLDAGPEKAN